MRQGKTGFSEIGKDVSAEEIGFDRFGGIGIFFKQFTRKLERRGGIARRLTDTAFKKYECRRTVIEFVLLFQKFQSAGIIAVIEKVVRKLE